MTATMPWWWVEQVEDWAPVYETPRSRKPIPGKSRRPVMGEFRTFEYIDQGSYSGDISLEAHQDRDDETGQIATGETRIAIDAARPLELTWTQARRLAQVLLELSNVAREDANAALPNGADK